MFDNRSIHFNIKAHIVKLDLKNTNVGTVLHIGKTKKKTHAGVQTSA